MWMLGLGLVVVVLVVGMKSLQVISLLDVLHLLLNTRVGGVVALKWRGGTNHSLPFVVFVLLQLERVGSFVVVSVVVFVVVALIDMMIWFVVTPLWSKWLGTGFTVLVLTPVLSHLFTHVLAFEFQVGDLRNIWLIDSSCSRHMTGDKGWFSSLILVVSKTYITFGDNGRGRVLSECEIKVSDKVTPRRVALFQSMWFNLLFMSQLLDEGVEVLFRPSGSRILDSRVDLVCMVLPEGQVFRADFSQSSNVERCFLAGSSSELWKWHDEDITMLDTCTLRPSPRYKSSPTQLPRSVRIQPTPLHYFDDISLIRHRNEAYKDALEWGRRRRRFGSGPSSRRFVDNAV
jgi:hypothetical protein